MKLPFLERKEKAEYYLALVLRNEIATAVILEKVGTTIKYVSHGEEEFQNTIETAQTEEFLDVLDKSITTAEGALPENIETHKTIFGLKDSWIEDNKIKKECLDKLKKASVELSLEPIGFLSFTESIIKLVQKDEGAPVTAVLADVGSKFITVSLIKAGRIIEAKTSEIHQSASFTVDTLLKHFQTPEVLPSRIIIFDSEEEELTQEFMTHQWSKSLPFLHLPQIVSLPEDAVIKAMLVGVGTQMGTQALYNSTKIDVEKTLEDEIDQEVKEGKPPEFPTETVPEEVVDESSEDEEKTLGEVLDENVKTKTEVTKEPTKPLDYVGPDDSLEYFGFVQGLDVAKTPLPKTEELEKVEKNIPDKLREEVIDETPEETKIETEKATAVPAVAGLVVFQIKKTASLVLHSLQKINFAKFGANKLLIIPLVIVILVIVGLFLLLLNTKATISILVNPREDSKTASVTFSSSSPTDITNSTIAFNPVSVSEDGTINEQATGKKNVGTSAKGAVTIFNITTGVLSLSSGTSIISPNGLKFTLDNDVTVASGDAILGAATATVKVTASDIGQDYNLPSGTKFSVSGQDSTVAAKNDSAFSGGTKKQVTVISKDDLQKALTDLPKQLEGKARNDIQAKVSQGNTILSNFSDETVTKQNFDKKENDQANQVTLKGTVTFSGISYKNGDIVSLANSIFKSSEAQLSQENLSITAKNIVVEKNNDISADLTIKAGLLPKIDPALLSKQVAGTPLLKAKNIISNLPQVENVGIVLKPDLFFLPQNLPGNPKNITILITAK